MQRAAKGLLIWSFSVFVAACDEQTENPCLEELEEATRGVLEQRTLEELCQGTGMLSNLPVGCGLKEAAICLENPDDAACFFEPDPASYERYVAALEEQLLCLENRNSSDEN